MLHSAVEALPVVSAKVYALILTSPRLRQLVLPEGVLISPYEILDYDATLTLHDPQGMKATFQRKQSVRFLQDGVGAILDHAWGDGVVVTSYENSAGRVVGTLRDEGRRHLVVQLPRPMRKGETLTFAVTRTVMEGFRQAEEWWEVDLDHPVRQMRHRVVFPKARPCLRASGHWNEHVAPLSIVQLADGRTMVECAPAQPRAHTPYTIRWTW